MSGLKQNFRPKHKISVQLSPQDLLKTFFEDKRWVKSFLQYDIKFPTFDILHLYFLIRVLSNMDSMVLLYKYTVFFKISYDIHSVESNFKK